MFKLFRKETAANVRGAPAMLTPAYTAQPRNLAALSALASLKAPK